MSYCRYSSMDFQCDLYVYECQAGVAIQIAKNRPRIKDIIPEPPEEVYPPTRDYFMAQAKHFSVVRNLAMQSPIEPIGLPLDGQHFLIADYDEAADKLIELFDMGYNVPLYAIELLHEDAAKIKANERPKGQAAYR